MTSASRLSTGVPNLDHVLGGGLPGRYTYLLQGAPGTGKTTMALQFLLEGVAQGETCLFVTLSQTRYELEMIAASHGWSLDGILIIELQTEAADATDQTIFYPMDVRLDATKAAVVQAIEEHAPQRLVYDSLVEVRQLSRDEIRFQRELLSLKQMLHEREIATIFIDVAPSAAADTEIESLVHGIFRLERELPQYGQARRRLDVSKMRGVDFFDGYHDMDILAEKGVVVFPRVVPHLTPEETGGPLVQSGVQALDDMLGGGLEPGTTSLIIGQAGTGKSTLASLYLYATLKRGENAAMFLFEERPETFFRRSEGLGFPLREFADDGHLQVYDFNPTEISQGQFNEMALRSVDENDTRVVVIDSFTGYITGLPHAEEAIIQIQLLLKYLARRNVLTILVVAQRGLLGHGMSTEVDVSFLGDTVIFLRMFEWPARIRRTISIVKKRHGPHDLDIQQLKIDAKGISLQKFVPPPPGPASPSDYD
ncbi:ATPase domain-containing protein [Parvularcula oceani]|uniref:ATPase domain-containing protein n=1 Tax=Parvularcula oceani TaxID=1247963 RepID=UPI0004E21567|nr:ATPase domain-containing protein [Parvularcula oceani]